MVWRALILWLMGGLMTWPVCAQNAQEFLEQKATQRNYLLEQIAAYRLYAAFLKQGYETAHQGLSLLATLQGKQTSDHTHHFELYESSHVLLDVLILQGLHQRTIQLLSQARKHAQDLPGATRSYGLHLIAGLETQAHTPAWLGYLRAPLYQRRKVLDQQIHRLIQLQSRAATLLTDLQFLTQQRAQQRQSLQRRLP